MFQELNSYFFQYKTVCIPQVGTFKIVQQPAVFDVVNQRLLPPQAEVLFTQKAEVPQHQLQMLAHAYDNNTQTTEEALGHFGKNFKYRLQQQPFSWQGVGELALDESNIQFKPQTCVLAAVPAYKILRENVQHSVLVGDTEMQLSAEVPAEEALILKKRSVAMILGWICLLLAAVFIIYQLYQHRGKVTATGLQQKASMQRTPLQYK